MNTPDHHPLKFIQKVAADPKSKEKISLEELVKLIGQFDLIEHMRDKGLMAVFMSQMISFQFSLFFVKLKTVHSSICRVHGTERRRKDG